MSSYFNCFLIKYETLQDCVMRIISFSDFAADPDPIYKYFKILKFPDLVTVLNCLFVHDFLNNKLPSCFSEFFTPISHVNSQSTKNVNLGCLFIHHKSSTKFGLKSTNRKCINSWNYFSRTFNVNLNSLSRYALKQKLITYFIESY